MKYLGYFLLSIMVLVPYSLATTATNESQDENQFIRANWKLMSMCSNFYSTALDAQSLIISESRRNG